MVFSAQHHLITVFKQQISGAGRTFHRGEGKGFLRQFLTHAKTKLPLLERNSVPSMRVGLGFFTNKQNIFFFYSASESPAVYFKHLVNVQKNHD